MARISDIHSLRRFCQDKIDQRDNLVAKFKEHEEKDTLAYFMKWNGITIMGAVFHAMEAKIILDYLSRSDIGSDEEKFDNVKKDIANRIADMEDHPIDRRSTSLAANLEEDYHLSFVLELNHKFNSLW